MARWRDAGRWGAGITIVFKYLLQEELAMMISNLLGLAFVVDVLLHSLGIGKQFQLSC